MPLLKRQDYSIHYEWSNHEPDDLPVLMLSHPLGSELGVWDDLCEDLRSQYRILRADHQGHGKSTRPDRATRVEEYGEDVLALLEFLDLTDVTFCGVSLGGMVGQWLGVHASHRVSRLILANTCGRIENNQLLRTRIETLIQDRPDDLSGIASHVIDGWLTSEFQKSQPDIARRERERLLRTRPDCYAATAEAILRMNFEGLCHEIQIPTLVIGGERDKATPPDWNRALAARIPGASYRELPVAHLSHVEARTGFGALLTDFS